MNAHFEHKNKKNTDGTRNTTADGNIDTSVTIKELYKNEYKPPVEEKPSEKPPATSGGGNIGSVWIPSISNPVKTDKFTYDDFTYDDFTYDDYMESDIVTEAKKALAAQLANKPGAYQSQWQGQLNDVINKILNREKFSYDLNGDALYQQYKDKYTQQAKMAMADTMGQAAAMTGGYGNSYAQSVGQQMYAKEMQNLNDVVPELYAMAYDKYNQEGQDLYNQYSMLGAQEDQEYGRYRDSVSDWLAERDYLQNRYDSERNFDYSKYNNERDFAYGQYADDRNFNYGQYSDDRNLAYTDHRNTIADSQWQAEFDEAIRQYNASLAAQYASIAEDARQFDETMKYNKEMDTSSGGSSGSGSGGKPITASMLTKIDSYADDLDGLADHINNLVALGYDADALTEIYIQKQASADKSAKNNALNDLTFGSDNPYYVVPSTGETTALPTEDVIALLKKEFPYFTDAQLEAAAKEYEKRIG